MSKTIITEKQENCAACGFILKGKDLELYDCPRCGDDLFRQVVEAGLEEADRKAVK